MALDQFRSPQLGDTIRTVEPMQCDTPMYKAGEYLRVVLATQASVEEARRLVAARRWCVEQPKGEA